jgi:predicted nucleic acid-binding protein
VSQAVLLDAGPLGLVTNPRRSPQSTACAAWLQSLITAGVRVLIPEIADYEVRRELLRARKTAGVERLDALAGLLEYLPITTAAMRQAAAFWATARLQGQPTASEKAIDGDVILTAQGATLGVHFLIATTNVGHLSRFASAKTWQSISVDVVT